MRTIPKLAAATLVALALIFGGILTGLSIPRTAATTQQHTDPRWTIPAPCAGCGVEITTYYPNHKAQTVNYFSGGGQQVTWSGVWVNGAVDEGWQK